MYSRWQIVRKYLQYYLSASNGKGHGIHSPFIFHFVTQILNDKNNYPAYDRVEKLRSQLLRDQTMLQLTDLGAGSVINNRPTRTVSTIAANSAKPKKYAQLLYRMVKAYHSEVIVELGTSLGITSSYVALGHANAKVYTIEGAEEVAAKAFSNFRTLSLDNIVLKVGDFNTELPRLITDLKRIDFCFIDGNHQKTPTLDYFEKLIPVVHNNSVLVFDDIHWSRGMEEAWMQISKHPLVRCTVDLFFIGIVFFREEFREKQHFSIRF